MMNYTYADFQELTFEEFLDLLWKNHISEKIVSTEYYLNNIDFITALTFDCYRYFQMDRTVTIIQIAKYLEFFFYNLFRYKAPNKDIF